MISIFQARNKADQVNNFEVLIDRISRCIEEASAQGHYHIVYAQRDRYLMERLISYFQRTDYEVELTSSSTLRIYWG